MAKTPFSDQLAEEVIAIQVKWIDKQAREITELRDRIEGQFQQCEELRRRLQQCENANLPTSQVLEVGVYKAKEAGVFPRVELERIETPATPFLIPRFDEGSGP